ncbi:MAG: hypothetical protein U5R49_11395 [Deltaproteobacteria bacterium]|nr:hypothetical protein [Deltaproteobacteria bacterium]
MYYCPSDLRDVFVKGQKSLFARFAIIDTDRHHGNGTRDIFLEDDDVLHVCFCSWDRIEGNGKKICVNIASPQTDESYMEKVEKALIPRLRDFRLDMILHNLGHDTCQLDYGDIGLTEGLFQRSQEIYV